LKQHQDHPDACYKLARCLYRLSGDEELRKEIIKYHGENVIVETTDNLWESSPTLLNCLKLINRLVKTESPELFQSLYDAGIPNVVIKKYHNVEDLASPVRKMQTMKTPTQSPGKYIFIFLVNWGRKYASWYFENDCQAWQPQIARQACKKDCFDKS
jgi:hypothetical protein